MGGKIDACINDIDKIAELSPMPEILEASSQHELNLYPAAILWHSNKDSQ